MKRGAFASFLAGLGFTRDDAIWLWGRIVGAALAVASGVLDLHYWAGRADINLSDHWVKVINVLAIAIVWVSGKQASSHLPPDPEKH